MEMPWSTNKSDSMSESPPTPPPQRRPITTRLWFGDDDNNHGDNDDDDMIGIHPSASTPQPYHRSLPSHKRPIGQNNNGADDNNNNMWVSPHISPSLFKTIDGRTVYSRNPFSPMVSSNHSTNATHYDISNSKTTTATTTKSMNSIISNKRNPVPAFPVALSATSSWDEGSGNNGNGGGAAGAGGGDLSKVKEPTIPRLERRDSTTGFDLHSSQAAVATSVGAASAGATDYCMPSSSGSLWTSSKIRRLTVETNDVGKGQPSQRFRYSYHDHNNDHPVDDVEFLLDTDDDDDDRVSPTDVVTQFVTQQQQEQQQQLFPPPSTPSKPPRPMSSSAFSSYFDSFTSTPPRNLSSATTSISLSSSITNNLLQQQSPEHQQPQPHPPNTPQLDRRSMPRLVAPLRTGCSRSGGSSSTTGSGGTTSSMDSSSATRTTATSKKLYTRRHHHHGGGGNHHHHVSSYDDDDDHSATTATTTTTVPSRFSQDFDILQVLGQGSFGTVYKCLSRLDGCLYAIKATLRPAKGHADKQRMFKEVYALAALSDHADPATFHIVRYHQAWMESDCRLYIQTELCTCTLAQESRDTLLSVPRRYKLLREMCLALDLCHRNGMVHLDIKPDNIFVKNDQYKLGDFGLVSRYRSKQQPSIAENNAETVNDNDDNDKHEIVEEGDSRYMSRELLSGDWNDLTKCDMFSLGATVYQICVGRPLPANGPEWHALRSGQLSWETTTIPTMLPTPIEMSAMIQEMMHPDPWQRPPAAQMLQRRQLLSEERKALIAEQNKVREAALALAETRRKYMFASAAAAPLAAPSSLHPPPKSGGLIRANTWNGGF